jgi:hypothetical protein
MKGTTQIDSYIYSALCMGGGNTVSMDSIVLLYSIVLAEEPGFSGWLTGAVGSGSQRLAYCQQLDIPSCTSAHFPTYS